MIALTHIRPTELNPSKNEVWRTKTCSVNNKWMLFNILIPNLISSTDALNIDQAISLSLVTVYNIVLAKLQPSWIIMTNNLHNSSWTSVCMLLLFIQNSSLWRYLESVVDDITSNHLLLYHQEVHISSLNQWITSNFSLPFKKIWLKKIESHTP